MRIVVVSKADVERIHTLRLLDLHGIPHTIVVHDREAERRLCDAGCRGEIVRSGTETLVDKRNWILKKLIKRDEWFVGMDDNIQKFTRVRAPFLKREANRTDEPVPKTRGAAYDSWRQVYNAEVTPNSWLETMDRDIALADKSDIPLVGVATMENPYFRARRYSNYRFVKTKVYAMRNTGKLHFHGLMGHDSYLSALCVAEHGKVLVDQFLHYKVRMYERGGLGTSRAERDANGLAESLEYTIAKFPGLVAHGRGENTALRFVLNREKSVERWRREHGFA